MNKLESKADWNILRGRMKQKWATLTDDDRQFIKSKEDQLLARIQKRNGEAREVAERALHESCTCDGNSRQPELSVVWSEKIPPAAITLHTVNTP